MDANKFSRAIFFLSLAAGVAADGHQCTAPGKLRCHSVGDTSPTLDGDFAEWAELEGLQGEIHSIFGTSYDGGEVTYKCQYDSEKIYFALEIPGPYRFDTEDNKLCAAIGTMLKIGSKAAFINMGGCPEALTGCDDVLAAATDVCADYKVDLGAHWELRTTEQGVLYPMNTTTGTGNDLVANNDDEYGVSAFCKADDNDEVAANEWEGAWTHSNPTAEGADGVYRFEIARLLVTPSTVTDKQLAAGETYEFGIAYWDPFERDDFGWTEAGHFLTGCAAQWIDLTLETPDTVPDDEESIISCSAPGELLCQPVDSASAPVLDANFNDWADIEGLQGEIHSIFGTTYDGGEVTYKCQYDSEKIYFALEIPGPYRFDTEDNKLCAAIGTMLKIGSKAAFINMGGCPEALTGCDDVLAAATDVCADYKVDLGAHWELRTTEQGVLYPMDTTTGTGNDLVANNDDEYGVSAFCRADDNDEVAGNEWEGAWEHSNPTAEGADGVYRFEIARLLETPSMATDKQLAAGETYEFGIAYWDPFEKDDLGWTEAGHFLTGCASQWIDLKLVASDEGENENPSSGTAATILMSFVLVMFSLVTENM